MAIMYSRFFLQIILNALDWNQRLLYINNKLVSQNYMIFFT